jgi:hypothetical protein
VTQTSFSRTAAVVSTLDYNLYINYKGLVRIEALAAFSMLISEIATVSNQEALKPLVLGLFIFGESLADPRNYNHLASLAKANFPPYRNHFDTKRRQESSVTVTTISTWKIIEDLVIK